VSVKLELIPGRPEVMVRRPWLTTALLDGLTHRCHILETGNDSFRSKASSAVATRKRKEATQPLTQT